MAECCMACGATRPIVSSQSYNSSTLWCKQRFPASPAFTSSPLPCFTDLQSVFKFHPPFFNSQTFSPNFDFIFNFHPPCLNSQTFSLIQRFIFNPTPPPCFTDLQSQPLVPMSLEVGPLLQRVGWFCIWVPLWRCRLSSVRNPLAILPLFLTIHHFVRKGFSSTSKIAILPRFFDD